MAEKFVPLTYSEFTSITLPREFGERLLRDGDGNFWEVTGALPRHGLLEVYGYPERTGPRLVAFDAKYGPIDATGFPNTKARNSVAMFKLRKVAPREFIPEYRDLFVVVTCHELKVDFPVGSFTATHGSHSADAHAWCSLLGELNFSAGKPLTLGLQQDFTRRYTFPDLRYYEPEEVFEFLRRVTRK